MSELHVHNTNYTLHVAQLNKGFSRCQPPHDKFQVVTGESVPSHFKSKRTPNHNMVAALGTLNNSGHTY